MSNSDTDAPALPISPSLIVGIVIISAFAVVIVGASVFRFCKRSSSTSRFFFDDNDTNYAGGDNSIFNPNAQRTPAQIARMKEVRNINNMYAWERGQEALMEAGELRPTTTLAGRKGEARNWDEWSTMWENNRESMLHRTEDYSGDAYLYSVDDPYAPSSQQRLSHAPSVLLPQPLSYRDLQGHHPFFPERSPLRGHRGPYENSGDGSRTSDSNNNSHSTMEDDHNMENIVLDRNPYDFAIIDEPAPDDKKLAPAIVLTSPRP